MSARYFTFATALLSAHLALAHGGHDHHGDAPHSELAVELPFDPLFCDLNGNGRVDKGEMRKDNLCMVENPSELFSQRPISSLGLRKGQLVLTTDDGPNRHITPKILDLLDSYNIKATFFVVGKMAERNQALIREMVARGHVIGNHTYSHPTRISAAGLLPEILKAHRVLVSILGHQPPGRLLFRAPGLAWSSPKALVLNDNRVTRNYIGPIHANIGATEPRADWSCWKHRLPSAACANMYFDQIVSRGRGIILSHDIVSTPGSNTYEMLKILLRRLDAEGGGIKNKDGRGVWEFVTMQNLPALDPFEADGGGGAFAVPLVSPAVVAPLPAPLAVPSDEP